MLSVIYEAILLGADRHAGEGSLHKILFIVKKQLSVLCGIDILGMKCFCQYCHQK